MLSDDLEPLIDRRLRSLPPPTAPGSLVPRVMAAVAALASLPWYRRGWAYWPAVWQAAASLVLAATAAGFVLAWPVLADVAAAYQPSPAAVLPSSVRAAIDAVGQGLDAFQVVWRVLVAPVSGYFAAFVFTMCAACLALAAAFDRVALGGPSDL